MEVRQNVSDFQDKLRASAPGERTSRSRSVNTVTSFRVVKVHNETNMYFEAIFADLRVILQE
jgi:hypothetical protein